MGVHTHLFYSVQVTDSKILNYHNIDTSYEITSTSTLGDLLTLLLTHKR